MSFGWRRSVALGALAFGLASGLVPDGAGPLGAGLSVRPAAAQSVSFDLFFSNLDAYGTWIPDAEYGYIWTPQVGPDWRPYQRGNWVWTDEYGWMWQSREPFAWATYHYGRWGWNQYTGWYWVPGDEWAPAWVSWRHGGGVIGWAPLGPAGRGYAYGAPERWESPPQNTWIFVSDRDFTAPDLYGRMLPPAAVPGAWRMADRVYYPSRGNGYMENRFLAREEIARVSVRPPEVRRVVPVDRRPDTRFYDDRVEVYRPRIDGRAPARPLHPVMDRPRREGLDQPYPTRPDLGPVRPHPGPGPSDERPSWGPGPDRPRPGQNPPPDRPTEVSPGGVRPDRPRPDQHGRPDPGWGPGAVQPGRPRPDQPHPGQPRPDQPRPDQPRPERPRPGPAPSDDRPTWGPGPDRPRPGQNPPPDRPTGANPGGSHAGPPRSEQHGRPDAGWGPGGAQPERPHPGQPGRSTETQPARPARPNGDMPHPPAGGQKREPQQVAPGAHPPREAPPEAGAPAHKRPPRPETE